MFVVITSCSANKDESVSIPAQSKIVEPSHYLDDKILLSKLSEIRKNIFEDTRANIGQRTTYAFDLYVRAGKAYKDLLKSNYHQLKERLLRTNDIEWFFLSGGYGIIHALEKAKKYQATFNRSIACQRGIPYTADLWKSVLAPICDTIFSKLRPVWVYVLGSRDYTQFVKETNYWKRSSNITMFESTGSTGSNWLSPILNDLVSFILSNKVDDFNSKHEKITKQEQ